MGKASHKAQDKARKAAQLEERKRVVLEVFRGCDEVATVELGKLAAKGIAPTCTAGCSHCCALEVPIARAEGEVLVAWLEAHKSAEELEAIRAKLRAWLAWFRGERAKRVAAGMAQAEVFLRHAPKCALLDDDGRCGAYEARPVTCRNHYVKSPVSRCAPATGTIEPDSITEVSRASYDHVVKIRRTTERQGGTFMASIHLLPEWLAHLLDVERDPWAKT